MLRNAIAFPRQRFLHLFLTRNQSQITHLQIHNIIIWIRRDVSMYHALYITTCDPCRMCLGHCHDLLFLFFSFFTLTSSASPGNHVAKGGYNTYATPVYVWWMKLHTHGKTPTQVRTRTYAHLRGHIQNQHRACELWLRIKSVGPRSKSLTVSRPVPIGFSNSYKNIIITFF